MESCCAVVLHSLWTFVYLTLVMIVLPLVQSLMTFQLYNCVDLNSLPRGRHLWDSQTDFLLRNDCCDHPMVVLIVIMLYLDMLPLLYSLYICWFVIHDRAIDMCTYKRMNMRWTYDMHKSREKHILNQSTIPIMYRNRFRILNNKWTYIWVIIRHINHKPFTLLFIIICMCLCINFNWCVYISYIMSTTKRDLYIVCIAISRVECCCWMVMVMVWLWLDLSSSYCITCYYYEEESILW